MIGKLNMPLQSANPQSHTSSIPSSPLRLGTRSGTAPFPPPSSFFLPPPASVPHTSQSQELNPKPQMFAPPSPPPITLPPPQASNSQRKPTEEKEERENTGRWTLEEHSLFLEGLRTHGKGWKQIAAMIQSRSVVQIRTHAQKYFQKLSKAQSQNGGQPIGEVFMDTRPNGDSGMPASHRVASTANSNANNLAPLLDLDTAALTSTSKRGSNNGKSSRKPKGRSNSPGSSPRRKRKMEGDMSALSLDGNSSSNTANRQKAGNANIKRMVKSSSNLVKKPDIFANPSPASVADPLLMGLDGLGLSSWYIGHPVVSQEESMLASDGVPHALSHTQEAINPFAAPIPSAPTSSTNQNKPPSRVSLGNLSLNNGFEHPSAHEMLDLGLDWFGNQSHRLEDNHFHSVDSFADATLDDMSSCASEDDFPTGNRLQRLNSDFTDDGSLSDDSEMQPIRLQAAGRPTFKNTVGMIASSSSIPIPPPPNTNNTLHPLVSPCITAQPSSSQHSGGLLRPKGSNNQGWNNNTTGRKVFQPNTNAPILDKQTLASNSSSLSSQNDMLKRPISPSLTEAHFTALDTNLFDDVNFDEDVFNVSDLLEDAF